VRSTNHRLASRSDGERKGRPQQAALFDSSDGVAPPRTSLLAFFLNCTNGLGGSAAGRALIVSRPSGKPASTSSAWADSH